MQIEQKQISEIIPYAQNAKKHPKEQIQKIAASIKEFGFLNPIIIDKNNVCIAGHGRLEAAKEIGMIEVPVLRAEHLTEQQIKVYRIADNRLAESEWDMDLVIEELRGLDEPLIDLTGFDTDFLIAENENDDIVPEIPEEPKSKLGDLYILGPHRVLCGDSSKIKDIEKLMDGKKADMIFTDPPYRMDAEGGSNQWVGKSASKVCEKIKDIISFEPKEWLSTLCIYFEKGMNAYIFCNKDLVPDYLNWAKDYGYFFNILFWKKPNALPLGNQHKPDVEYIITIRKNAIWHNAIHGVSYSKSLEFNRENSNSHPTIKPVELIVNELKISSNKAGIVVDPFLGNGSTLIACEKTKRICFGMELEPRYIDVIVQRYCDYVGNCEVIKNGDRITWQA